MALFGRKERPAQKSLGLGRSTETVDVLDRDDDDDLAIDEASASALSDEIMAVDRMDRSEIDADLDGRPVKKGLFGSRGKDKPVKEKKAGRKSKAVAKAEAEEEIAADLDKRLSTLVEIEELPGVSKEDAIETARHQAQSHCERPSNSFFNVLETRRGFLIEVQEGVGRSYLPSVQKLATENPGRPVVVPMMRRLLTVVYSPRTDSFDAQILGEEMEAPEIDGMKPLRATRGPAMTPVFKQHQQWLVTGVATAGIGFVSLLASIAFLALDPATSVPPEWRTTTVEQLPILQWGSLVSPSNDSYVVRLEYQDGKWRTVRQSTFATVEENFVPESSAPEQIVGGVVAGPASPEAPPSGATGVPGGPVAGPSAPSPSPPVPAGLNQ